MRSPRRRIQEHGDESQAQKCREGDVQIRGHGVQHERCVAGGQPLAPQERRGLGSGTVERSKRGRPRATAATFDDGRGVRAKGRLGVEQRGDVHGPRGRANRA